MTPGAQKRRTIIETIGVFAIAAAVFAFVDSLPSFRDPDAFYHAKMADLMLRGGIVRDFPWLPFTTFASPFADQHFLYHALLVPFAAAWGPFVGLKVATVVFGAFAAACFYLLLREYGVRWPFFFAFVLATSSGFVYRAGLGKANALSAAVLFIALILLKRRKARSLAALSFLYVWLYGGWPLMLIAAGAHFFGVHEAGGRRGLAKEELRCAAAVAIGLVAGLVVNPYFPSNFALLREQLVQIGVVGYRDVIAVGAEWYAPTVGQIVNDAGTALQLLAVALLAFAAFGRKGDKRGTEGKAELLTAGLLAAVFFAMMLRNSRHVEYAFPFLMLFDAMLLSRAFSLPEASREWSRLGRGRVALLAVLVLVVGVTAVREVRGVRTAYERGWKWTHYGKLAAWLHANVPDGAVLFHGDWEDFPALFFLDDRIRYLSGLDPTFFYRKDPAKFREWADVADGTSKDAAAAVADFGAKYVLVRSDREAMRKGIEADGRFRLDYADEDGSVYELAR